MTYRDQYDYGDEYDERRRDYPEDEGFFDRVRGWFRERVNDIDRNRSRSYERGNRDYGRDRRGYGDYRDQVQRRDYRFDNNRDFNREYAGNRGPSDWERTRQWRRDYNRDQENQGRYVNRYGQRQPRYGSGRGADEDYEYGLGRNPDEEQDYRSGYKARLRLGSGE
jgi:hypothetical protein